MRPPSCTADCVNPGSNRSRAAEIAHDVATGQRFVLRAYDEILVDEDLLAPGVIDAGAWEPHDCGGVLTLDSAGEYRYRYVRRDSDHPHALVFQRIPASEATP